MRFAAWNVEGRLASYLGEKGKRGTPDQILRGIEALDADVLVLPEAYNGPAADVHVDIRLQELGYDWFDAPYNDPNREEEIEMYGKSNIRIASRIGFVARKIMRFGGQRNLLVAIVEDPKTGQAVQAVATHLEDRTETQRQQQIDDIAPFVRESGLHTVEIGDFNATWPGLRSSIIGSTATRLVVRMLPGGSDLKSELSRLVEMTTGTTLQRLCEESDLREVDPRHQATVTPKKRNLPYLPSIPLFQLDHMLISRGLSVTNFKVAKDNGSDHRAISADITVRNSAQ